MTLLEKLSNVRDFRKILETTVKEIGESYSSDLCQIILSNPLDSNFTSICEYIANPGEEPRQQLPFSSFPLHLEGGGLGVLSISRLNALSSTEINEIRITLANIADVLRYAQINDLVQRDTFRSAFMSEISTLMNLPMGLGDALFMVVNILGKALQVSRCIFICVDDSRSDWKSYEYWQRERIEPAQTYGWPTKDSAIISQTLLSPVPIASFEGQSNSYKTPVQEEMEFIGVRSQLSVAIRSAYGVHGAVVLQHCESRHAWTRDEIDFAQSAADSVAEALAQLPEEKRMLEPIMRLHQHDVAETKTVEKQNIQEIRKALKGALRTSTIAKAQSTKKTAAPAEPPKPPQAVPRTPSSAAAPKAPVEQPVSPLSEPVLEDYSFTADEVEQAVAHEQGAYALSQPQANAESDYGAEFAQSYFELPPEVEGKDDLEGLAAILQEQAELVQPLPAEQSAPRGGLGSILGAKKAGSGAQPAWDIPVTFEQPPPPGISPVQPDAAAVEIPLPGNLSAASSASRWGDLDSIPTPSGSQGELDRNNISVAPVESKERVESVPRPASKWGDLDSIPSPQQGRTDLSSMVDTVPNLNSIPAQPPVSARTGLGAMMMGKAKASAVGSGIGLSGSFHRGGVKPPAPPSFIDGPPIQIDEAAAEAKLKQILASSNPTSDYIFATPGLDMRLLGRIDGWIAQVEAKDKHLEGHARAVAEYSSAVARLMGLGSEEVNNIRIAAIVHDVGKMTLPQQILQKPDEELTDEELVKLMNHTIAGAKWLESYPELAPLARIVLAHHEEYNGNGYPEGLSGEEIPIEARIIFVCNSYVEMVGDLVYRRGLSPEQAQESMIRGRGGSYDPDVVDAFMACISQGIVPAKI